MPWHTEKPRKTKHGGFTLLELLVVLVVMALAYGLVAPSLAALFDGPRLDDAARRLTGALREARGTAVAEGRTIRFQPLPDGHGWRFGSRIGNVDERVVLSWRGAPAAGGPDGAPAILFFAAGGSGGGRLELATGTRRRLISVHWLTGRVAPITP